MSKSLSPCKFKIGDVVWYNHPKAPDYRFATTVLILQEIDWMRDECLVSVIKDDHEDWAAEDLPILEKVSTRYINSFSKAPEELAALVRLFYC